MQRISGSSKVDDHFREIFREKGSLYRHPVSQLVRFESVARNTPLYRKSLLDIGCGTGDFAAFLADRGKYPSRYTGMDVVPEFVAAAADRVKAKVWGRFPTTVLCNDFMSGVWNGMEVIACIGVLEDRWHDTPGESVNAALKFFRKMCQEAHRTAVATFAGPRLDEPPGPTVNVIPPAAVIAELKGWGFPRFVLDDSYAPHCYTVVVHKGPPDFERWRNNEIPEGDV